MGLFSRQEFGASGNLGKISDWLKNPNASEESKIWNYGRYAYITISTNGTNNAGLCPPKAGVLLGDSKLQKNETYTSLVSRDGDRDVPSQPILTSVRISNDGSTDVSDSALFDIDVAFDCFSASQFEIYEEAFFRTGNGVTLQFGYKGLTGLSNSMTANVYNFSFSMDASGKYSCTLKLTGKNRFAAILGINQALTEDGTVIEDDDGNQVQANSIISELNARFIKAFPDFEESSFIQKRSTVDFVLDGTAKADDSGRYAVANIQSKSGGDFTALGLRIDFDDVFVKYVTFEELINVINKAHSKSGFKWGFGPNGGAMISEMASADPTTLLLDGDMAVYTEQTLADEDTFNDLRTGIGFDGTASKMLLSLDFIGNKLKDMVLKELNDKDSKGDTSVNNFLLGICNTIKELTGGLYQLTLFNDGFNDSSEFLIVNERAEHESGIDAGYTFTMHDVGSTLKSVSLSSNMDSEMAAVALVSNRSGEVPKGALDNLYSECGGVPDTVSSTTSIPTLAEILTLKQALGSGISPFRSQDLKEAMKAYVVSQPKKTKTDAGYRYMIDLSVSHWGVWGTKIGDTFTFSGLPKKYKGKGKYFCVGKMEHTFDAQGNWETQITGFLKLDTV